MLRILLVPACLAILAGCASPPPAPQDVAQGTASANDHKQVCAQEKPVGSNIPVMRCHDEDTDAQARRNVDVMQHESRPVGPTSVKGG
jgi:hypothetical protein